MSSLTLGPEYFPPRRIGAQLIMRGPHGAPLAGGGPQPQPQPGGGFRWWDEQLVADGKKATWWTPQQQVVGVAGLGADPAPPPPPTAKPWWPLIGAGVAYFLLRGRS